MSTTVQLSNTNLFDYFKRAGYEGRWLFAKVTSVVVANGLSGPQIDGPRKLVIPEDGFDAAKPTRPPEQPAPPPPTRGEPIPTVSGPPPGTDPALVGAVGDFERAGGTGTWFSSTLPDRLGGSPGGFFLVKDVPASADPNSRVLLLRTEQSRKGLETIVREKHAPVVLGHIPEETAVQAAALSGFALSRDALAQAGRSDVSSVMLLTPNGYLTQMSHEFQHWKDYETRGLEDALRADLSRYFDPQDVAAMTQITLELRGHAAQIAQARKAGAEGYPFMDRGGNVQTDPTQIAQGYKFEANFARSIFEQAYSMPLLQIAGKLSPEQRSELIKTLSKYDFSKDSSNPLTFERLL